MRFFDGGPCWFSVPSMAAWLWARCWRWRNECRQLTHLHELDERMLRDIGLTRGDVIRRVPFRQPRRLE